MLHEPHAEATVSCDLSVTDSFAFPTSFSQERLWFLEQLRPGTAVYNAPHAVRLRGPLDIQALEQALSEIVRRHESLQTTFAVIDGRPRQIIAEKGSLAWCVIDLSERPETDREAEALRLATAEAQQPFDLTCGPLLRTTVLRLSSREHIFLVTLHHIISDGWSIGIFFRELSALYAAFSRGVAITLPDLPIQYADFAVWQREWLQGEVLESHLAYWRHQLAGAPSVIALPTDHARPPVQSLRGAKRALVLPAGLSAALRTLSRRCGVTLYMTLLAAFQTLLARHSGQQDILVGSPIAGRSRRELEGVIGFFANTLVLRTDFTGDPSFRELLERVRDVALGAFAHQDLPFEQLVEALQTERTLSHAPLFQVMFVLQNSPQEGLELEGLSLSPIAIDNGTAKFDLVLSLQETAQGLQGWLEYNADLFEAETIDRLLAHFETLLHGIVAAPDQRVSALPLLTETERRQILVDWNNTSTPYFPDLCLHQLFEAQVERTPDAVALVFEHAHLTYRTLNARANRLARYLRRLGVGPDVLVGLLLESSLEMIVAILAVLKAGGAYVPLAPEYPKERLAFMLEDASPLLLLTQERLSAALPRHRVPVVCIDACEDAVAQESPADLANAATAENLAYVIYTSGSTGKPKGVMVSHANVARLLDATQPWFQFSTTDVWTLFHSYAFDFSVWELWGALRYGGRLVVVPYWVSRSPEAFYDLLQAERVTVLNQTPSAFRQLIPVAASSDLATDLTLRLIIFGGEALNLASLRPWIERHGDQHPRLVNMYGITETTVHVTYRPLTAADVQSASGSLIGRRIPDLQVYVLDAQRQPVPIGVPGEIYVGGAGLARGYLNRPELTPERFVPHSFSKQPGARLYRSGDLARYLPDGDLEYLGRCDQQVKLRGYRIELGEIEATLGQHPAVQACAVLAREDQPGEPRLVAYVVPRGESAPSGLSLRRFLQQYLPEYMVPAAFVVLAELPLTANGKLDRSALPTTICEATEVAAAAAPRDAVERALVDLWEELLRCRPVGIHDNFFDRGGHSLLAAQLLVHVEEKFGRRLPLASFFQCATIADLAGLIRSCAPATPWRSLVPIQPGGTRPPLFLVHGVFGDVLCFADLVKALGPDQPCYGLRARGLDGIESPLTRLADMARHYIEEIRTVQRSGPYCLAGLSTGGSIAYEMACQLHASGERVGLLVSFDHGTPASVGEFRRWNLKYASRFLGNICTNTPHWVAAGVRILCKHPRIFLRTWLSITRQGFALVAHRGQWSPYSGVDALTKQINDALGPEQAAEWPEYRRQVMETLYEALVNYKPQPYPGQLTLIRARRQPLFSSHDPTKGWDRLALGGLTVKVVPGNHANMLYSPHVEQVAQYLATRLGEVKLHS
jgi:amino acid adenylation domain-containing protein